MSLAAHNLRTLQFFYDARAVPFSKLNRLNRSPPSCKSCRMLRRVSTPSFLPLSSRSSLPPPRSSSSAVGSPHPSSPSSTMAYTNIFDLANAITTGSFPPPGPASDAFHRTFHVINEAATCHVPDPLRIKYNIPVLPAAPGAGGLPVNEQQIVGITNRYLGEQVWFNRQRTQKPQTFAADGAFKDPTDGGAKCDFCKWEELTAVDSFGRIERPHAVSASNLFKYGSSHGLILLKSHDPLSFSLDQLSDLILVSSEWFRRAIRESGGTMRHPLAIWNSLPRSGASQYHPHAQLLVSQVPYPVQDRLQLAALRAAADGSTAGVFADILAAHEAAGLARRFRQGGSEAWLVANLGAFKDMEVQVFGRSMEDPAFIAALHVALRALIDRMGCQTFNVGLLNLESDPALLPAWADVDGAAAAAAVASGGAARAARQDGAGSGGRAARGAEAEDAWQPVFARVMSRGKLTSAASDFGGLEVIGGGSIGHTDPYVVMGKVDEELRARGLL